MMRNPIASRHRQHGWVGLVVLLLALVIVAVLMKTVLQQYGLTGGTTGSASKATQLDPVSPDGTVTAPSPRNALERARGLESSVQQQAKDIAKRIDDGTK
jgi:hypothetical protein